MSRRILPISTKKCINSYAVVILLIGSLSLSYFVRKNSGFLARQKQGKIPIMIQNTQLGTRPNPEYPGHDSKGFRNRSVPEQVEIVALGDSQTYGIGVAPTKIWTNRLTELSGLTVYNMAWGGYGPLHSLILWDEALQLRPKIIIEALYAGNDLFDCYEIVYYEQQQPDFKTTDEDAQQKIATAEQKERLQTKVNKIYQSLIRTAFTNTDERKKAAIFKKYTFSANYHINTVLTPEYRLCALDMHDPRIQEGKRIALGAIETMHELAQKKDIMFIVVLIPTKELVFKDVVYSNNRDIRESYKSLIESEELFWKQTKNFLKQKEILFVDTLLHLRDGVEQLQQPYPSTWDGHPNDFGYKVIAECIYSEIKKNRGVDLEK